MNSPLFAPEKNRRNIFLVLGIAAKGTEPSVYAFSNRQLLLQWIMNKGLTYLDGRGKPKIIDSYSRLQEQLKKTNTFNVCISVENSFEYYQIIQTKILYEL